MLRYLPYLLVIVLWIYAFVDCLATPAAQVRALPKVVWILIILFFGEVVVGPLAWLFLGRRRVPVVGDRTSTASDIRPIRRRGDRDELPRPPRIWLPPDDNPEFLRSLDELNKRRNRQDGSPSEGE